MLLSFHEVVDGLTMNGAGSTPSVLRRKRYYYGCKDEIIRQLTELIGSGSFRITNYTEFWVTDGPKIRKVQSPSVFNRIGCNAIMRVVEKYVYRAVIPTSAASIKGRGMHHLHRKLQSDYSKDSTGNQYAYTADIRKFYESIDKDTMKRCIHSRIKDPVLLPMLDSFVDLMPRGLSIGLRSSQCFGNILLSDMDHRIKEREHCRYYYRYCDNITARASTKAELWKIRDAVHEELAKLGLEVKPDEAIRPVRTEGLDALGFVDYGTHCRIRKRTKQKFARHMAKVKSRKRRTALVGSFKGMAKWGDCAHLYKTLTGEYMRNFSEFGLVYQAADGKKRFGGEKVALKSLVNIPIIITDFEKDVKATYDGREKRLTLVSFQYEDGRAGKYFTEDQEQLFMLERLQQMNEIPFRTVIKPESYAPGKVKYKFT